MGSLWSSRNKSVALLLRGLRMINLAAVFCIRCRRAMLTADVPYKRALQQSGRDVIMALITRSFVGLGATDGVVIERVDQFNILDFTLISYLNWRKQY